MNSIFLLVITVINSFVASTVLTKVVIDYLHKRSILDKPNKRSSHVVPVPRGAGIAIMPLILFGIVMNIEFGDFSPEENLLYTTLYLSGLFLCCVTWCDDLKEGGLSAKVRLLAQIISVSCVLWVMPSDFTVFQGFFPIWADRVLAGLAWIWFINLFNFMDGINGITGVETVSIMAGIILMGMLLGVGSEFMTMMAALIMGAAMGFLVWNWGHAKVFLGDVGSIGLGYLGGALLLLLASYGGFFAAIIIPLYYLMDATITLIKRLLNKEKIWEAHRKHYYQAATVEGGLTHAKASSYIAIINCALIIFALISKTAGAWILVLSVIMVYGLLCYFKRVKKKASKN